MGMTVKVWVRMIVCREESDETGYGKMMFGEVKQECGWGNEER